LFQYWVLLGAELNAQVYPKPAEGRNQTGDGRLSAQREKNQKAGV